MLIYFDTSYISLLCITTHNTQNALSITALVFSYIVFVTNIVLPVLILKYAMQATMHRMEKHSVKKIAFMPAFYFARRLIKAFLLMIPDSDFVFLSYMFSLLMSHLLILFLVAYKPYKTRAINTYVLANELLFSCIIYAMCIFTDATSSTSIKTNAATIMIVFMCSIVAANVVMVGYCLVRGRLELKKDS